MPARWTRPLRLCAILAACVVAAAARAEPFKYGEVEGVANLELSYGLLARVEDRDEDLIAIVNGGNARSANFDDGDLNYDQGVASNELQVSAELAARWSIFGVYVRGLSFYDFETELVDRERTPIRTHGERYAGSDTELREYFVDASFLLGGMPVRVRVGDQSLNWGESTFLRFGVPVSNATDFDAAFRPASSTRDVQIPEGMVWAAANLTEELALEAYYEYDWEPARTPPVGWYFSDNDSVGSGELGVAMLGSGLFSDLGTNLDSAFALPPGTLGFDPDFMRVPGHGTDEAKSQGQFGVTLQAVLTELNSTKVALHYARYHSKLPIVSARTANGAAAAATSLAAVGARAAELAPIYEGEGLSPAEAAAAAASAASTLTIGEYASRASYSIEYPEDVQMIGFSFNTATLRTGSLLSGEISHHFDAPFQILASEVIGAALSPIEFTPRFGEGPLGDFGPSQKISGVKKLDRTEIELGLRQLFGPRLGASQSVLGLDVGWVHVHGMPDENRLPLSAPGITGPADYDHLPTSTSWGYRVIGALIYEDVLGGLTVQPRVAWVHDVGGITPGPGDAFIEGRKAIGAGIAVDYINRWGVQLDYTTFFGGGRFNLINDRDFVRLQVSYYY